MISTRTREICRAAVLGMSQEARDAENLLFGRPGAGPLTLLGVPGPHRALLDRARRHGALEGGTDDGAAPTRRVVIPMSGIAPERRRAWREAGHELVDLTLPAVRRLHALKALMRAQDRRIVVAGFRDDPECQALAGEGVTVVEDADAAASLPFAPRTGLLSQTTLGARRFATIELALRLRHPDSDVAAMDTRCPSLQSRERALAAIARRCDMIVVLADPADRSGQALYEVARCLGVAAARVADPDFPPDPGSARRIGLTAGIHTPDEEVDRLEARLREG
jgi:4-hydroxy-3-methylbut-2-enyl diphosphate reductase